MGSFELGKDERLLAERDWSPDVLNKTANLEFGATFY